MRVRDAIPASWTDTLGDGPLGLGLDLATTTKGTSNPSSLSIIEERPGPWPTRLVLAWKTDNPEVTRAVLICVMVDIVRSQARAKKLSIDASNETFFASQLRREWRGAMAVELVKSGVKREWKGEDLNMKTLLGNLYVNALDAGEVLLPAGDFLVDDYRLVKRASGSFATETGKNGQHGDTFDSGKLAYWSLLHGSGTVRVEAVQVGSYGAAGRTAQRPGVIGSIVDRFRGRRSASLNT